MQIELRKKKEKKNDGKLCVTPARAAAKETMVYHQTQKSYYEFDNRLRDNLSYNFFCKCTSRDKPSGQLQLEIINAEKRFSFVTLLRINLFA